jgi:endonuclease/exonuclease/phosphatase family metal-dependent hydrolase
MLLSITLILGSAGCEHQKTSTTSCIAFYNLENLFDTINQEHVTDEEFTADGKKEWTPERYLEKLDHLARVIYHVGLSEKTPEGASLIGVCELENASVMEDLANTAILKERNYKFVHYDSPYYRGMDVALFYQPEHFSVLSSSSHELNMPDMEGFTTRAQLLVSGVLNGDTIHVIVNHWPSRRGGEEESRPLRIAAAELSRSIVDSLFTIDPQARIIIMGDLNDDPDDISIKKYIQTSNNREAVTEGQFYNPFEDMHEPDSVGTLMYRGKWNLFDQILISASLTPGKHSGIEFIEAGIFKEDFLIQQDGRFKGSPFRTYSWDEYISGYSDHLPVYIYLSK